MRRYGNGFAVMLPPRFDEGQSATMRLEMSETSTVEHSGPLPKDDEERSGIFDASFDVFDVRDGIAAVEIAFERCEVDGVEWWRDMYDDCDGRAGTERVHDDGRMMTHIMGIVGGNAGGDIVFPTEPVAAGAVWTTTEELFIAMIDGLEVTARFELTELTDDHYVLERAINVEIDHETEYQHHTGRFRSTTEIRGSRYDPLAVEATGSYRARVRSESSDLGSESTRVTEGEFTVSQR